MAEITLFESSTEASRDQFRLGFTVKAAPVLVPTIEFGSPISSHPLQKASASSALRK
ncbi:MAG TPA: hypothetical protein VGN16_14835 [Acidobacteriaceae bacterium]|jgi:hypothetical protein